MHLKPEHTIATTTDPDLLHTLLEHHIELGNLKNIQQILQKIDQLDKEGLVNKEDWFKQKNLLMMPVMSEHTDIVRCLLNASPNPETTTYMLLEHDKFGTSPLYDAVLKSNLELIHVLLAASPSSKVTEAMLTSQHHAAGHAPTVLTIATALPPRHSRKSHTGMLLINPHTGMLLIKKGMSVQEEITLCLLNASPNPESILNARHPDGDNALTLSLRYRREKWIALLIEHGAKISPEQLHSLSDTFQKIPEHQIQPYIANLLRHGVFSGSSNTFLEQIDKMKALPNLPDAHKQAFELMKQHMQADDPSTMRAQHSDWACPKRQPDLALACFKRLENIRGELNTGLGLIKLWGIKKLPKPAQQAILAFLYPKPTTADLKEAQASIFKANAFHSFFAPLGGGAQAAAASDEPDLTINLGGHTASINGRNGTISIRPSS